MKADFDSVESWIERAERMMSPAKRIDEAGGQVVFVIDPVPLPTGVVRSGWTEYYERVTKANLDALSAALK